jgi:ferric-dicitrate binding protein FerR (iron transport regulator)
MSKPLEDTPLEELFLAYWDDGLTDAQAAELTRRLTSDPQAREAFEAYCLNAVVAADLPRAEPTPQSAPAQAPAASGRRGWSRRRVLQVLGGALAAGVGGVLVSRQFRPDPPQPGSGPDRSVRLGSIQGEVALVGPGGNALPTDGPVIPGSTVRTTGPSTSAVLFFPNGTNVALSGDSNATLSPDGNRVDLHEGVVTADIRPPLVGGAALTLATARAVLPNLREVIMTLDHAPTVTEVVVRQGSVNVAGPTGRPLDEVRSGELLTVRADGHHKEPIPHAEGSFNLDLNQPLPRGWGVGERVVLPDGPAVRAVVYKDPYYGGTPMYQIRSDKQWTRGFFRIECGSAVRVKYRADRPGRGQVCFCTRMADAGAPETGMLEWNGTYAASAPGGWNVLTIPAEQLLLPPNGHVPKFGPPWVAFLLIFNTFEDDIGLTVSEFRVNPPDRKVT